MNDTIWRVVVGVLAVALAVVGGILIAVLLGQGGPNPTASPSAAVSISPSPRASLSPSPTLGPSPTASPTLLPTFGQPATPPATPTQAPPPTAAPTAAPTLTPGGPMREIKLVGLGLDGEDAEGAVERLLTFQVDGPAQINVAVSNVTAGRVHTCLWRGDALNRQDEECINLRKGRLERTITEPGPATWSVSLIGRGAQISPSATVALSFHAQAAAIAFDNLRFQGTGAENYNGITAEFPVLAGGDAHIIFEIDDGADGQYPYSLIIERLGPDGGIVHQSGGPPAGNGEASQSVSAGRSYRLTLSNTQEFVDQQVFVRGTLSWP